MVLGFFVALVIFGACMLGMGVVTAVTLYEFVTGEKLEHDYQQDDDLEPVCAVATEEDIQRAKDLDKEMEMIERLRVDKCAGCIDLLSPDEQFDKQFQENIWGRIKKR